MYHVPIPKMPASIKCTIGIPQRSCTYIYFFTHIVI